jgi:hypothetical protein
MADLVKDKLEVQQIAQQAAAGTPALDNPRQAAVNTFTATHTMSKGERWYNWVVYQGMNYWLNLAMSVVITDIFKNRGGKNALKWTADKISRGLTATTPFKERDAFHHSKTALETFALLSGGNILLIPLKWLEDRKRPIVHWFNKKLGVDQTADDGHELTPDEIYIKEKQPEQSWGKIIWRRVLGILAVVGIGHVINGAFRDRTKPLPMHDEPDTYGGKTRITDWVMGYPNRDTGVNKVLNSGYIPGGKWLAKNEYAQAYMGFTVLDSIFTAITAVIMRVTNGAKKNGDAKEKTEVKFKLPSAVAASDAQPPAKNFSSLKSKKPEPLGSYTELAQQKSADFAMTP